MSELVGVCPEYNPIEDQFLLAAEGARASVETAVLLLSPAFYGVGVDKGDGHPVLVLPGKGGTNGQLPYVLLRRGLENAGYRPYRVRKYDYVPMGNDSIEEEIKETEKSTIDIYDANKGTLVTVVGHSMGGGVAEGVTHKLTKAVAEGKLSEHPVRHRVTLATPLAPAGTDFHRVVTRLLHGEVKRQQQLTGNNAQEMGFQRLSPDVLSTRIYSRLDPVVHYDFCQDKFSTNIEVNGSHLGMPANLEVFNALLHRLPEIPDRARTIPSRGEVFTRQTLEHPIAA